MNRRISKILVAASLAGVLALPGGAQALSLGGLFGSPVDASLAAQVPQDKRGAINQADYDLACAKLDVELAKLKEELADRQDDLASLGTKLAKNQQRGAEFALDIAKMEAIIASGLGKPEDNAKILADLKADRVKNESERIEYKAKIEQNTLFVRDWTQRVAAKEKTVAEFKARRSGGKAEPAKADSGKDAAKVAKPDAPKQPVDDSADIINTEPVAPAAQAPATPEADLKN